MSDSIHPIVSCIRSYSKALLTVLILIGLSLNPDLLQAQKKNKKDKQKGNSSAKQTDPKKQERIDYLYIEACTQHLQGNLSESAGLFREVISLDSKNHAAHYNLGKVYAEMKLFDDARRHLETALTLNKENYWYYHDLVQTYISCHRPALALSTQEDLVKKFPKDRNGLYDLAQMYIVDNRFQEAIDLYDRLESIAGLNQEVAFRKHQLYLRTNQPEKALSELDKLIKAYPSDERYLQNRYDLLIMMGRADDAMTMLDRMLESNPNNGFALISLADHYKSKGQVERSESYLFRAFRSKDLDIQAKVKIIAGLHQLHGQEESVKKRLTTLGNLLVEIHPQEALAYSIRGDLYQDENKPDSARYSYLRALDLEPANESVWIELLNLDLQLKDPQRTVKDAEKALEYFPSNPSILMLYGESCEQANLFEEAIYAFEKLKKMPSNDSITLLQSYTLLGGAYHKSGNPSKSDAVFEEGLKVFPDNPFLLNDYAYYLSLRKSRLDQAEQMAKKALDKRPNSSAVQDTYGWIAFLKGDFGTAEHWLKRAAENGGSAEVWEHLGDVYHAMKEAEKAENAWKKAIEMGGEFKLSDKRQ
jgi:predicted Zn-dependent protease